MYIKYERKTTVESGAFCPAQRQYSTKEGKMEEILECSCGLDVHKDKIEACILKTGAGSAYRETFGCISSELNRLCE